MESLTSILNLTVSLISLAAVTMGLNLLNDYKSKVQPRLDNEEYLMELLKSEVGREKVAELHKADWSATTQFSTVRRFVTNKRNKS